MDSLIAKLVYEYALETYKAIQLLNMSGESVKQQASQLERLEQAAAEDQAAIDRKGDPARDDAHVIREISAHSSVYWPLLWILALISRTCPFEKKTRCR